MSKPEEQEEQEQEEQEQEQEEQEQEATESKEDTEILMENSYDLPFGVYVLEKEEGEEGGEDLVFFGPEIEEYSEQRAHIDMWYDPLTAWDVPCIPYNSPMNRCNPRYRHLHQP